MVEKLFEIEQVTQDGEDFIYESHFKVKMNKNEYNDHINFLNNNIKTLKSMISKLDPETEVEKKIKEMQEQLLMQKEALENWDKYVEEQIVEIRKDLLLKKKATEESVKNHLINKDKALEQVRIITEKRKEPLTFQLDMDLNKLKGEFVFCTNAFFLMFPKISWRPQYYTCVDTRVLPDRARDIIKMHKDNPDMVCFFPHQVVDHQTQEATPTEKIIPPASNRIYFSQNVPLNDNLPFSAFSIEANKHLIQPYTVSITVLQLAYFLGFEPMYLIGCDTDYKVPSTVRMEGEETTQGKMFFTSTVDDDPNHFSPDYFGKGRKWHNPQVENMIWHYMMAHEATAICGRHIYNATVGGKLEVFPRVNFDELFE